MLERIDVDLVFGLGDLGRHRLGRRASSGRDGREAWARRDIQTTVVSNWSATRPDRGAARTSPREQSTSSARVRVTDWPATARSGRRPGVTTRATRALRGRTAVTDAIAGATYPAAIRPEKPRKSRLGRLTHCTGMRKARCSRRRPRRHLRVLQQRRAARTTACWRCGSMMLSPAGPRSGWREVVDADLVGEPPIVGDDRVEGLLAVADQVHLVDRQHHVADAEQRDEVSCAAGSGSARPCARRSG